MPKMTQAQQREAEVARAEAEAAQAEHDAAVERVRNQLEAAAAGFIGAWDTLSAIIANEMKRQGFDRQRVFAADIALMHSELSESLEADRKSLPDDKLTSSEGRSVELADCVIRILHAQRKYGLESIGRLVVLKAIYNTSRPFRHGKEY